MLARLLASRTFKAGLMLLVVGTGPLVAIILAAEVGLLRDPNPNPIGPGLLAFFTFWPSVLLMAAGAVTALSGKGAEGEMAGGGGGGGVAAAARGAGTSLLSGPKARVMAGLGGALLIVRGFEGLATDGRGAAAAMVIGAACIAFAAEGRIPAWFRR